MGKMLRCNGGVPCDRGPICVLSGSFSYCIATARKSQTDARELVRRRRQTPGCAVFADVAGSGGRFQYDLIPTNASLCRRVLKNGIWGIVARGEVDCVEWSTQGEVVPGLQVSLADHALLLMLLARGCLCGARVITLHCVTKPSSGGTPAAAPLSPYAALSNSICYQLDIGVDIDIYALSGMHLVHGRSLASLSPMRLLLSWVRHDTPTSPFNCRCYP